MYHSRKTQEHQIALLHIHFILLKAKSITIALLANNYGVKNVHQHSIGIKIQRVRSCKKGSMTVEWNIRIGAHSTTWSSQERGNTHVSTEKTKGTQRRNYKLKRLFIGGKLALSGGLISIGPSLWRRLGSTRSMYSLPSDPLCRFQKGQPLPWML